jgi:hypothetical protein
MCSRGHCVSGIQHLGGRSGMMTFSERYLRPSCGLTSRILSPGAIALLSHALTGLGPFSLTTVFSRIYSTPFNLTELRLRTNLTRTVVL